MLANASSDEGPTLVPHMLNPMLYQFNDLPARNNVSFFFALPDANPESDEQQYEQVNAHDGKIESGKFIVNAGHEHGSQE